MRSYKLHGCLRYFPASVKAAKCEMMYSMDYVLHVFVRPRPVQPQCEILPSNGSDVLQRRSIQSVCGHQPWTRRLSGNAGKVLLS